MNGLPKYIQNANKILEIVAQEPEKTWTRTQRELGETLGLTQPDLSNLIRLLRDNGRLKHGHALPGRGRIHALVVTDETPLDNTVTRTRPAVREEDRALAPGEEVTGVYELGNLSLDQVGLAVIRMIKKAATADERHVQTRAELTERVSSFREQLAAEREMRTQMARNIERLEREKGNLEHEVADLRGEVNKLLINIQSKRHSRGGGVPIAELLEEGTLDAMKRLLTERPGDYRKSDQEILAS